MASKTVEMRRSLVMQQSTCTKTNSKQKAAMEFDLIHHAAMVIATTAVQRKWFIATINLGDCNSNAQAPKCRGNMGQANTIAAMMQSG